MTSGWDLLLLGGLLLLAFLVIGYLWDWLAWKLMEKRVNRHATERWLLRNARKESHDAESRHDEADH